MFCGFLSARGARGLAHNSKAKISFIKQDFITKKV